MYLPRATSRRNSIEGVKVGTVVWLGRLQSRRIRNKGRIGENCLNRNVCCAVVVWLVRLVRHKNFYGMIVP